MNSIVIHSDNKADLDILIKMAKRLNAKVEKIVSKSQNPSPSNDPYFDNPDNIRELKRRMKNFDRSKCITLTPVLEKELFE